MKTIVFTLCSNNYLAQAKTLGDSLIKHNPDFQFIIGLVDDYRGDVDYSILEPHEIIQYEELGCEKEFSEMVRYYNIVELNTAVKPFYIDYLFNNKKSDILLYIDPDIQIYKSFDDIIQKLEVYDVLLTPHLLYPRTDYSTHWERLTLNVGVYNLGFLGLRRSGNVDNMVSWWKKKLEKDCKIDFANGLFVDQIWMNFSTIFFDNVHVLKDPGYNMGYWNFSERILSERTDGYYVNDDYPLHFFHFSNYNPLEPDTLCKWLDYSFEQRPDLVKIYNAYRKTMLANKYEVLKEIPMKSLEEQKEAREKKIAAGQQAKKRGKANILKRFFS